MVETEELVKLKFCTKCGEQQIISDFHLDKNNKDGHRNWCKLCCKTLDQKLRYWKNPEEARRKANEYYLNKRDEITAKRKSRYQQDPEYRFNILALRRKNRLLRPELTFVKKSFNRAKKSGLEFDISIEDIIIPEVCPVFGTPFERLSNKLCDTSPTLDRIDSSKGYIKGNIKVISWRANRLKSNASLHEIEAISRYMKESL